VRASTRILLCGLGVAATLWFLATLYHVRLYAAFIDAQTGCGPTQLWDHQVTLYAIERVAARDRDDHSPECKAVNSVIDRLNASDRTANFSYVVAATAAFPWLWPFLLSGIRYVRAPACAPFDSEQDRNIVVCYQVGSVLICFGLILFGIVFLMVL